jgi:hypothetical protein
MKTYKEDINFITIYGVRFYPVPTNSPNTAMEIMMGTILMTKSTMDLIIVSLSLKAVSLSLISIILEITSFSHPKYLIKRIPEKYSASNLARLKN